MKLSRPSLSEYDILKMRTLLQRPGNELTVSDFDELIALESIRLETRIWSNQRHNLIAFAFVDDFNNLRFAVDEKYRSAALEEELVGWGVACQQRRNAAGGERATLDASCCVDNRNRLAFLEKHGFIREETRTLNYQRDLLLPISPAIPPDGFSLKSLKGEEQAGSLAALHRAAFGTNHMTLEYRLAMMRVPHYDPNLDLFIEAPTGKPVAFCFCSIAVEENEKHDSKQGYTDPIGVDPGYQGRGLGKAVLIAGLQALKNRGMEVANLATSSQNIPMQKLAESAGFLVVSEKMWFSKIV